MPESAEHIEPAREDANAAVRDVSSRKISFASLASSILAIILLLWVCSMSLKFGGMEKIFNDFDTSLPSITLTAMRIGPAGFIAVSVGIAILLVVKEWLMRDKEFTLLINIGACAVALGMWFFLAQAMLMPMISLIQGISK